MHASWLVCVVSALVSLTAAAAARPGVAPPPQPARDYSNPGRYELEIDNTRDGRVYVPKSYKAGAAVPLLVWLHGAGGQGNISTALAALADEFNVVVLAPDSREWTWDAILGR